MIEIKNLTLRRGLKTLLENADATITTGRRVGLIGKNGSGKSSLFAMIRGEIVPDSGQFILPAHWQIATVAQETPALDISAIDYVLQGDPNLPYWQNQLREAEKQNNGMAIAQCHAKLEEIDAYTAPARAAKLLDGLGFTQAEQHNAVKTFSGGWRMRLNLAQALMADAQLLLLDEPTNHLDLETVLWLEQHLSNRNATQIIISHDADFLNATCTQIIELSNQKLNTYGGNYDYYQTERAQRLIQHQAAWRKQQAQIEHLQNFINRFKAKATKAAQAQSRVKALEKIQRIAPAHLDSEFVFQFNNPDHLPNPLLKLDQADLGYDGRTVLHQVNLSLESGARYGLLGVNGSGKSTFIKTLAGYLKPINGQIIHADKLKIGYFAQHQLDTLRDDQSPLWHIRQFSPDAREQEIRNFLGGFNFTGETATAAIAPFSGGEKARLALALLVWQKPNLLLLDEPTNHLDLDMRHALTLALQDFAGAMILVSHDRSLLESTTDRFLLIESGYLKPFDGDLEDYRRHRLNNTQTAPQTTPSAHTPNRKDHKRIEAQLRQERARLSKPILQQIQQIETQMAQHHATQAESEAFLATESAYSTENKAQMQTHIAKLATIKVQLSQLEEDWLTLQEQLEHIQTQTAYNTH